MPTPNPPFRPELTRRQLLSGVAGAGLLWSLRGLAPSVAQAAGQRVDVATGLSIHPRDEWGSDLPPGPLRAEKKRDVRFLLVHHTATSNAYARKSVIPNIRDIYRLHTGPEKGWPDIAYNFLVDRHGGIWEARAGSIERPIKGDATGGSQGFALLCSFMGNHQEEPVTPKALSSMVLLLAWLANRYAIDPSPGATTSFVSRGSNKWPRGTKVRAGTISGHRDMSQTVCPGDFVYPLLDRKIPLRVAAALAPFQEPGTVAEPSGQLSTPTPTVTISPSTTTRPSSAGTRKGGLRTTAAAREQETPSGSDWLRNTLLILAGSVAAAIGGIWAILRGESGRHRPPT